MTAERRTASQRIVFANQLRGLAALCVAVSHLVGVYWLMRDVVTAYTFSPAQPGSAPPVVGAITLTWFNFGPFGVGIFFLISGLVVPISLEKHTRLSFLAARALRIYPTYLAALCVELAILHASSRWWHIPFGFDMRTIVQNALLIYNLTGVPSIDLVNWTLCIELKFYLLLSLLAAPVRRGQVLPLIATAAALLAGIGVARSGDAASDVAQALATEAVFMIFMFIGVLFNFRLRGQLGSARFVASVAVLGGIFVAAWQLSPLAAQYPIVTVNYGYALVLFAALYLARGMIRETPVLDFMAAISFPFYLLHSLVGYSVMKVLMLSEGFSYAAAIAAAVAVDVAIATALHFTVERFSSALGRRLARSPKRAPSVAIASAN